MKNGIVSRGLYVEGLRKIKIPAIIFAAIVLLSEGVLPFASALLARGLSYGYTKEVITAADIISPLAMIPVIAVPILTLAAFFAFNRRSSSDFYQSLPYTRECLFFSWMLSVLTAGAGLTVFGFALGCLSYSVVGGYIVSLTGLGRIVLYYIATMLFSMACVLIAMSVTGTFIANVVCALLLMFLPRVILVLIRGLVLDITPVLSREHFLNLFSVEYNAFFIFCAIALLGAVGSMFGGNVSDIFNGTDIGPAVATLVIAVIYIAVAAVLFKHRKSETATMSGSNRAVQHVIRIALTFAVSLLGTYVFVEEGMEVLGVAIYFIALIVFFAYEIITTRKWINLVKILPTLLIVAALNAGVWGFAHVCSNVIRNSGVDASSIRSVRILGLGNSNYYFSSRTDDIEIDDPQVKTIVADALNEDLRLLREEGYYAPYASGNVDYLEPMTVVITSGAGTIYRNVRIEASDMQNIGDALSSTEDFRKAILELPDEIAQSVSITLYDMMFAQPGYGVRQKGVLSQTEGFTEEEAVRLVSTAREEIASMDFREWYDYISAADRDRESCFILKYTDSSEKHLDVALPISQTLTPRTFEAAQDLFISCQNNKAVDFMISLFDRELPEDSWYYMNIEAFCRDSSGNEVMEYFNLENGEYSDGSLSKEEIMAMLKEAASSAEKPTAESRLIVGFSYAGTVPEGEDEDFMDLNRPVTVILPLPAKYAKMLAELPEN